MSVPSMVEVGKDFCPNVLERYPDSIDKSTSNHGSREFIPVFHNCHAFNLGEYGMRRPV